MAETKLIDQSPRFEPVELRIRPDVAVFNRIVETKPIVMVVMTRCMFCTAAIESLRSLVSDRASRKCFTEGDWVLIDAEKLQREGLGSECDYKSLASRLGNNHTSVPAIWIGGHFIGGYQELQYHSASLLAKEVIAKACASRQKTPNPVAVAATAADPLRSVAEPSPSPSPKPWTG